MTIAEINMTDMGSTGQIMFSVAETARQKEIVALTFSPYPFSKTYSKKPTARAGHYYYGTWLERRISNICGRIFGLNGLNCFFGTLEFIRKMKKNKVDLIHLHNLHGYCINLPLLFRFIKKNDIKVIWTLHDCWSFTGHCPHFTMVKCDKWQNGCFDCPQCRDYPQSLLDSSKLMWKMKKRWFTGVNHMTMITPSQWLSDLVKRSFLKEYPVRVINNGIDLEIFRPIPSDFRDKYSIPRKKYIILGVAFGWGERKGLDVFLELAKQLDSQKYQIVLVGTNDNTDKVLPNNIVSIHRTQNQQELAMIYSAADLFVNPTREEVLGLVNVEALACGTPGITFNVGGSPECYDDTCGRVVDCDNVNALEHEIVQICEGRPFTKEACLYRARSFDKNERFKEYIDLYTEVLK